jgi:SAM-dependent methyltransferase
VATVTWGPDIAETYDATSAEMFDPAVLQPAVDVLAELADGGPALEFAIGTGRVALALQERGVVVHGIELSPHMLDQLRAKPGGDRIPVELGDMARVRVPGEFSLVYLVWNTIMNVTTQDEQVAVFANAAAHLVAGGQFVIEVGVPSLRNLAPGQTRQVFDMSANHIGIDTFDDFVGQILSSHHWSVVDGQLVHDSAPYRFVWPSELDLMARLAGMQLVHRWGDWDRRPFTAESTKHVSVWRRASC